MAHQTDRDRWREIDSVFSAALDRPAAERPAVLDRRCAGDPELRAAVERLLEAAERPDSVLERELGESRDRLMSAVLAGTERDDAVLTEDLSGERLGAWRLVRKLARGGYATVYLGERSDGAYEQRVAVKILRRGLDTGDVLRRFSAERQILSSLEHAGIARLLDGGTAGDGRPYLVMEYVDGLPIVDYCRAKHCSMEQKLELLIQVATIVHHAHRHLVVHRDLKPSNILVTDAGQVRLLDFGIAKLLAPEDADEAAARTRTGFTPLTPDYASPEQLDGLTVTTASDVYQLGLLLYKLLTGYRPFEAEGRQGRTTSRSITPPTAPSTLARRAPVGGRRLARELKGDLDRIALKALMPEPSARYASAAEFATDLSNHLRGLPVTARPATLRYRLGKLLRRQPWLAPATAVGVALAAGYIVTVESYTAQLEAQTALAERSQQFLVDLFRSPDPFVPAEPERGRNITVAEALRIGADRAATDLAEDPALQASLFAAISEVYGNLDLRDEALRLRQQALALERDIHGPSSTPVIESLIALAGLHAGAGDLQQAEALREEALALATRALARDDPALARAEIAIGAQHRATEQHELAVQWLTRGIEHLERAVPANPSALMSAHYELATSQIGLGDLSPALEAAERGYSIARDTFGASSLHSAVHAAGLARVHVLTGEYEAAETYYLAAIPVLDRSLGEDHSITLTIRNNLAFLYVQQGDHAGAETVLREVLAIRARQPDRAPTSDFADHVQNLAVSVSQQGRLEEALPLLAEAHDLYRRTLPVGHPRIALPLLSRAQAELRLGRPAEAQTTAAAARAVLEPTLADDHYLMAVIDCLTARALEAQGETDASASLLAAAWALLAGDVRVPPSYRLLCDPAQEVYSTSD